MVQPIFDPEYECSTGEVETMSHCTTISANTRDNVIPVFEGELLRLFQESADLITGQTWSVEINSIAAASPGVPNWAGVDPEPREPIVYLIERDILSDPPAHLRRTSSVLVDEVDDNFEQIDRRWISDARSGIQSALSDPDRANGFSLSFPNYVPMVAEVCSRVRMQYGQVDWQEVQGLYLARLCFHEIAHCKAECGNRGTSSNWQPAISGSIHDVPNVGICASTPGEHQADEPADFQLMRRHMLCPMPFFKLDHPIEQQFHTHGTSVTLARRAATPPPAETEDSGEQFDPDDPMSMDI